MVASNETPRPPRFLLGQICATPGAIEAMQEAGQAPLELLQRHQRGDWGQVCPEDSQANEQALQDGSRILSVYSLSTGTVVWIITEADRSVTTILLPEEY